MALYDVQLNSSAKKNLIKINKIDQKKIAKTLHSLETEPRPKGVKKIRGLKNTYRVRVDNYRVMYTIDDKKLVVIVIDIDHRKDIYTNL